MASEVFWKPERLPTDLHGERTVYVKHWAACGIEMYAADTAFTVPAYIRRGGRRVHGYISMTDGVVHFTQVPRS